MNSEFIRRSFLDFFSHKGHEIVSSASLLPEAPNLLFTNAGMNPFVPYFLGQRTPPHRRLADTQKCIRAGGKHNDLEDVGFDTYHHTFFEMLGNWSFGDYFKEEAIQWAWELLTSVWSFPKERLYATVYRPGVGDPAEFDAEAYRIWTEIFTQEGLDPKIHVRTGGKKDNFWMMGNTGPCGPCTEIHMDLTPLGDTQGERVNGNHPACMEIWNLVFIQYDAQPNHAFEPLKEKFVDTGMGLERIAGIWAGTRGFTDFSRLPSNYDGDLFQPLFEILAATSGHPYGGRVPVGKIHLDEETLKDCAFRVLADHLRTLCFAIGDGIFPGHEGRHYVLRRILRRALLFGTKLSLPEHFFSSQSGVFVEKMGPFFKELVPQAGLIREVLKREEEIFTATLKRGIHLFEKWTSEGTHEISGEKAFLLYDTYGFPLDLTQLMASERGQTVNVKAFERCMETQRRRTKSAQKK
jgi:alanyl-tRNA synthetase